MRCCGTRGWCGDSGRVPQAWISSATFYKLKAKYGGREVSEARRLRLLEDENLRLKKLLAETMLDVAMLKDIASKNGDVRGEASGCGAPVQRAWGEPAAGVPRDRGGPGPSPVPKSSTGRQCCSHALPELAAVRRRFGWRRRQVLLSGEGIHMNHKKLRRLYIEERLQVRRRVGRTGAAVTRVPLMTARAPNQRWSMDFVHDALSDGAGS